MLDVALSCVMLQHQWPPPHGPSLVEDLACFSLSSPLPVILILEKKESRPRNKQITLKAQSLLLLVNVGNHGLGDWQAMAGAR